MSVELSATLIRNLHAPSLVSFSFNLPRSLRPPICTFHPHMLYPYRSLYSPVSCFFTLVNFYTVILQSIWILYRHVKSQVTLYRHSGPGSGRSILCTNSLSTRCPRF